MIESGEKKGQITIFVIIVIILISATALFFVFREDIEIDPGGKQEENPEAFFNSCMKDKVKESSKIISLHGGYMNNPLHKTFKFEGEDFVNISYLCYTQNNYVQCVNQKPLLLKDLKEEIKNYLSQDMENCFDEMVESFIGRYAVSSNYEDFEVEIFPKKIIIQTDSGITLTKSDETTEYKDFEISVSNRLYEVSSIVQEIINQEAQFCYAETLGIALTYPEFTINKLETGDTTIYSIEHVYSEEIFRFAIRACVIPPGML
jgi:hypothetical protein